MYTRLGGGGRQGEINWKFRLSPKGETKHQHPKNALETNCSDSIYTGHKQDARKLPPPISATNQQNGIHLAPELGSNIIPHHENDRERPGPLGKATSDSHPPRFLTEQEVTLGRAEKFSQVRQ